MSVHLVFRDRSGERSDNGCSRLFPSRIDHGDGDRALLDNKTALAPTLSTLMIVGVVAAGRGAVSCKYNRTLTNKSVRIHVSQNTS